MIDYESKFASALEYGAFLEKYGSSEHRHRWADVYNQFQITDAQRKVLATFVREMNVLCLAGAWCGDCVGQCPIFQHFANACPKINLRFVDRDADPAFASELQICGGARVPVVVLLSEDFFECGRYGDRTLNRYREIAQEQLGAAYPTGPVPSAQALNEVANDWLREFERVQLMLRLSPRLRQKHGD